MKKSEIQKQYDLLCEYYDKYLKDTGVVLPKLLDNKGNYIKDALVLIKLSQGYPKTQEVSKADLTKFIHTFYPDVIDVQQARHLSAQKGWFIISGTRGDVGKVSKGSYKLISLEKPYPGFASERRVGFDGDFENIKKQYNYRCAVCGSKEGENHLFRKNVKVVLQQGHMNPALPLVAGNIIPQCQICNRPDRNRWIYDKTGRVIEIANTPDGLRIIERFIKHTDSETRQKIAKFLKNPV